MIQINRYRHICDTCHNKKVNNFTSLSIQAGNIRDIDHEEDPSVIPDDDQPDNKYFPLVLPSSVEKNQHIMFRCWNQKCSSHRIIVFMDLEGKVVELMPI